MNRRLGVATGKPLADARDFAERFRATPRVGELPPLVLAALRRKMVALAGEIADGVVFANVARSHLPASLAALPAAKRGDPAFFVGNMIPTCISDDRAAAAAVSRRTLAFYLTFPNYRNSWREAGYAEEMERGREGARARGERDASPSVPASAGSPTARSTGAPPRCARASRPGARPACSTPILVPSSAAGNQLEAFEELFAAFA